MQRKCESFKELRSVLWLGEEGQEDLEKSSILKNGYQENNCCSCK